jgi:hypothetical protein
VAIVAIAAQQDAVPMHRNLPLALRENGKTRSAEASSI